MITFRQAASSGQLLVRVHRGRAGGQVASLHRQLLRKRGVLVAGGLLGRGACS